MKNNRYSLLIACTVCMVAFLAAAVKADVAPAVPDLSLPAMEIEAEPAPAPEPVYGPSLDEAPAMVPAEITPAAKPAKAPRRSNAKAKTLKAKPVPAAQPAPAVSQPQQQPAAENLQPAAVAATAEGPAAEQEFVPARETEKQEAAEQKAAKVVYAPATDRDPTLSPNDYKEIELREMARLRAIEAEKQRKLEAERRRLAELERIRQLELERLRDPSKEIRGKIHINGIIGQEVFIGNKVYTVGKTVLGARIVSIQPDAVVFMYKGQKFTKSVKLK